MYQQLVISPRKGHRYALIENFTYRDITVPAGYVTNGADVPWAFWSIFPPNRSDYMPAVIVHDYLCDRGEYKKADDYFEAIMKELEIDFFTIFVMVSAVRLWHLFRNLY